MANKELYRGIALFQVTTADGVAMREAISFELDFDSVEAAEVYLQDEMSARISQYSDAGHHWKILSMVVEKVVDNEFGFPEL